MNNLQSKDEIRPFIEILDYLDETKYFCHGICFDYKKDGGEGIKDCPPYITITEQMGNMTSYFFAIPNMIAYYATVHRGFTLEGRENHVREGYYKMQNKLKNLLEGDYIE